MVSFKKISYKESSGLHHDGCPWFYKRTDIFPDGKIKIYSYKSIFNGSVNKPINKRLEKITYLEICPIYFVSFLEKVFKVISEFNDCNWRPRIDDCSETLTIWINDGLKIEADRDIHNEEYRIGYLFCDLMENAKEI